MKSRILSIALALSLLAAIFVALPAKSALDYTGSVRTTDDNGIAKSAFIQGERVFVYVTLNFHGLPQNATIDIQIEYYYGGTFDNLHVGPGQYTSTGVYNSSAEGTSLSSGFGLAALDQTVYNVVVVAGGERVAQTYISVKGPGINLEPPPNTFNGDHKSATAYAQGQTLTVTVLLTEIQSTSEFYVQVVNNTATPVALPGLNWTAQFSSTGWWTKQFVIPSTAPDGAYIINVRQASNDAVWWHVHFNVREYVFEVIEKRQHYVPGMTALIDYYAFNMATLTPQAGLTISFSAHWLNHSGNNTWLNSTLTGSSGTQSFLIPNDIALWHDITIVYWANTTGRSDTDSVTLGLEALALSISTRSFYYAPGQTVISDISVAIGGEGLPGAMVNVKVSYNGTDIPEYGATNIMTDVQGAAAYGFMLHANAAAGDYILVATTTWYGTTVSGEDRIVVSSSGQLVASFDKDIYYSGETAKVNFRATWNNQEVTLTEISYSFTIDTGVLAIGNTSTMVATVEIPSDYYGSIDVNAAGLYSGNMLGDTDSATVVFATLSLGTSATEYRPGDTIEFTWLIVAPVDTGNLTYEIVDENGAMVKSGALTPFAKSGSFEYTVPTVLPSDHYHATIFMGLAGVFRTTTTTVDLVDDYELKVWVAQAPYADGGYRPGQTVTIHYSIGSYIFDQKDGYRIAVDVDFDPVGLSVLVTEPTGKIEYKLPSDTPNAQIGVDATLYDLQGVQLSQDGTAFFASNAESGWDRSVGGMSAIDFVLLVLLIIVIVMLILVPLLKGRMGEPKPPEPPPPADAGKTPP